MLSTAGYVFCSIYTNIVSNTYRTLDALAYTNWLRISKLYSIELHFQMLRGDFNQFVVSVLWLLQLRPFMLNVYSCVQKFGHLWADYIFYWFLNWKKCKYNHCSKQTKIEPFSLQMLMHLLFFPMNLKNRKTK